MKNIAVEDFYYSALGFCSLVDDFDINKANNKIKDFLVSLLELYSKALNLPDVEPKSQVVLNSEVPVPQLNFKQYNHYWEVFNPYQLEKPVEASLSDDILDIYKDVKRGIILYENRKYREAIWEWKLNFQIHWGNHAVDAIRVLHFANYDRT